MTPWVLRRHEKVFGQPTRNVLQNVSIVPWEHSIGDCTPWSCRRFCRKRLHLPKQPGIHHSLEDDDDEDW